MWIYTVEAYTHRHTIGWFAVQTIYPRGYEPSQMLTHFQNTVYTNSIMDWTQKKKKPKNSYSHLEHAGAKYVISEFGHIKIHKTLNKLILEGQTEGQRNRGLQNIPREKDVEEVGAILSVWTVGRTTEDRLMYLYKIDQGCNVRIWRKLNYYDRHQLVTSVSLIPIHQLCAT